MRENITAVYTVLLCKSTKIAKNFSILPIFFRKAKKEAVFHRFLVRFAVFFRPDQRRIVLCCIGSRSP